MADIKDGTANTVMVVESNQPEIPWLKPQELELEEALASNLAALDIRARHLQSRFRHAVEDPEAVTHAFQKTGEIQLSLNLYDAAMETASRAIDLYDANREVAGPAMAWLKPVRSVIQNCLSRSNAHAEAARKLAARAVRVLVPVNHRASLPQADLALVASLEALASPP